MATDVPAGGVAEAQVYAILRNAGIKKKKATRIADAIATSTRQAAIKPAPAQPATTPKRAIQKSATKQSATAKPATRKNTKPSTGYEKWTKADLLARAKTVGITGRSKMTRDELIQALRAS